MSSVIQRFKSANRHRLEQNGISGGRGSTLNFFPQVGHVMVDDLELIGGTEYPMNWLIGKWDSPATDRFCGNHPRSTCYFGKEKGARFAGIWGNRQLLSNFIQIHGDSPAF